MSPVDQVLRRGFVVPAVFMFVMVMRFTTVVNREGWRWLGSAKKGKNEVFGALSSNVYRQLNDYSSRYYYCCSNDRMDYKFLYIHSKVIISNLISLLYKLTLSKQCYHASELPVRSTRLQIKLPVLITWQSSRNTVKPFMIQNNKIKSKRKKIFFLRSMHFIIFYENRNSTEIFFQTLNGFEQQKAWKFGSSDGPKNNFLVAHIWYPHKVA